MQVSFQGLDGFAKSLPPTKRSVRNLAATLKVIFRNYVKLSYHGTMSCRVFIRLNMTSFLNNLSSYRAYKCRVLFLSVATLCHTSNCTHSLMQVKRHMLVLFTSRVVYVTEVDIKCLAAKAKITLPRRASIPRLELLGACLISQLVDTVRKTMEDELGHSNIKAFYWVDSIVTLWWIANNKVWKPYVQNRVSKILSLSSRGDWYLCLGTLNSADLASWDRSNLHSLWWEDPRFSKLPITEWPQHKPEEIPSYVVSEERKSEVRPM